MRSGPFTRSKSRRKSEEKRKSGRKKRSKSRDRSSLKETRTEEEIKVYWRRKRTDARVSYLKLDPDDPFYDLSSSKEKLKDYFSVLRGMPKAARWVGDLKDKFTLPIIVGDDGSLNATTSVGFAIRDVVRTSITNRGDFDEEDVYPPITNDQAAEF